MTRPAPRRTPHKAATAAAMALAGSLYTAASDGHLTVLEVLIAVSSAVMAAGTVYQIPNRPKGR